MSDDSEELCVLLEKRIQSARHLDKTLEGSIYAKINGVTKLRNRLASELRFLEGISAGKTALEKKYIETSNVTHFENIVGGMQRFRGVTAVFNTFTMLDRESGETLKHTVDLVCEEGAVWVKIISRSAKGIAMDWLSGNSRNVFEQAESYLHMASLFPRNFSPPSVVFEFVCNVPDKMAARLRRMGVDVKGDEIPLLSIVNVPQDFLEMIDGEEDRADSSTLPIEDEELPAINLDVSAVFVLVSNLTHPGGTEHKFDSKLLREQAVMERTVAARQQLLKRIEGRRLIICQTAYQSVLNIVSTVAGPTEKERVRSLLDTVEIVEDRMSERTASLEDSDRINHRSKMIFGSGDSHRAVTATANKHFVSSAFHQGVCFDVILHESRALSEQKEKSLS